MNLSLRQLIAVFVFFSVASAWSFDPCPVCGGKVVALDRVKDDRSKPTKNGEFFNRSQCGMMDMLLGGAAICTRCWMGSSWFEEDWKRMSELRDSFVPPIDKAIHDFPLGTVIADYERKFAGTDLTDSMEFEWDGSEDHLTAYKDYCKQHGIFIQLWKSSGYSDKVVDVTDDISLRDHGPRLADKINVTVRAKPKALYEKPLPPKRPLELRTAKAEFLRSAEALRTRYINELLQMRKKADLAHDDLAENIVLLELKSLVLPKDSDAKELTKLLIGKWKSKNDSGPIYRREGIWNWGPETHNAESAPWHVEGNELVQSYPKRDDEDEITTCRYPIILLNKTQFIYLEEFKYEDRVTGRVLAWERVAEKKRR